jgi:hypothetical protein
VELSKRVPGMVVLDKFRSHCQTFVSPTNGEDGSLIIPHIDKLKAMVESDKT